MALDNQEADQAVRRVDISGRDRFDLVDQPSPMVDWVRIDRLVIDPDYQRDINAGGWSNIKKIAADFRWSRFSPLLCAPVDGGMFSIIDGQHRAHAAAMCGIEAVPAMIVPVAKAEQARAFSAVNANHTRVSQFHIYRAALAAGDESAIAARDAVEAAGCRLMTAYRSSSHKKPGEVYAVALIRQMIDRGLAQAVTAGLSAIRIYDTTGRVPLYQDFLLRPWLAAVAGCDAPDTEALAAILEAQPPYKVIDVVDRAHEAGKITGPKAELRRKAFAALLREAGL